MKIFYVNGVSRSGKDTFINTVMSYKHIDAKHISTVDSVKLIAKERFGWDGVKDEKGKMLLVTLRSAWGAYNEGPINEVARVVRDAISSHTDVVFVQSREFPEFIKMQARFGGETILVERPDAEIGPTEKIFLDMVPSRYMYDHYLFNAGTLDKWKTLSETFAERQIL